MSWAIGFDAMWQRDIGYGVPAVCDHPDCNELIDRGLAHVCGGEPYGGEDGCGLFFCGRHLWSTRGSAPQCDRCEAGQPPFQPKPDTREWLRHKLTHPSWGPWRAERPDAVASFTSTLAAKGDQEP